MEFRRICKNETDSLVKMRLLYLREDFCDASDEQFAKIAENLPAYFEKHIDTDLFAFGAFDNGEIVSSALLLVVEKPCNPRFITGKTGDIFNVYTLPEYRRQGIAMKLMKLLMDCAKEIDLDFVELKATKDGCHLYKRLGFVEERFRSSIFSLKS